MKRYYTAILVSIRSKVRYERMFQVQYGFEFKHRLRNVVRRCYTVTAHIIGPSKTRLAQETMLKMVEGKHARAELFQQTMGYFQSIIQAQLHVHRGRYQAQMIISYGALRLKNELHKLLVFYTAKLKKLKHAAKVVAKLNDVDLEDIKTLLNIDEALAKWRQACKLKFYLQFSEQTIAQYKIYIKHA